MEFNYLFGLITSSGKLENEVNLQVMKTNRSAAIYMNVFVCNNKLPEGALEQDFARPK